MYVTVDEMIAEGVPDTAGIEAFLEERLALAQSLFEILTGRFFEKRAGLTISVSGRGHDTLWLPIPPVTKTAITQVEVEGEAIDAAGYRVVLPMFPDGRFNPKLLRLHHVWPRGDNNIEITGDFGFVEANESAPPAVKRAVARIAMLELPKLADGDAARNRLIVQESLKDYSYRLKEAQTAGGGYFDDPLIDNAIGIYARRSIGTP